MERPFKINVLLFGLVLVGIPLIVSRAQTTGLASSGLNTRGKINLAKNFPESDYTPHGYIDNPYHTMVLNRSGVIRSVPPLGFGYWLRDFKGSYGGGVRDHLNYLSILQMSVVIDGEAFVKSSDFQRKGIQLYSRYHTKHMMSYDWNYGNLVFSLKYFLPRENTLAGLLVIENLGSSEREVLTHATNIYGLWETRWWGSNGLAASYSPEADATISKIWAYGDIFVLGSNVKSIAHKSTESERQWEQWIRENDLSSGEGTTVYGPGPLRAIQTYKFTVPGGGSSSALFCLSRGPNERWVLGELETGLKEALPNLNKQLAEDELFWSRCPVLEGDWPESWKHGWVYDWETLRMNVRKPVGIYKHPWDAMQVHSPRVVLGETSLDMMTLSYADPDLAKGVIYGTFADALMPNVPCSREDGSVNMIGADGSVCGTAPMWGFPFHVIKSIYLATLDNQWIIKLYPYLQSYLEWWLVNRTDKEGWLHCKNSWESGQDGSRRFLLPSHNQGGVADFVRTVDVEASMAEAMQNMAFFAKVLGRSEDVEYWRKLSEKRIKNTRKMFVDGWFRDFDGRINQPIILENHYDVMMLTPLTCNVATERQVEAIRPMFQYFTESPHLLQWPPGVFTFSEAAWNAGLRLLNSDALADIADRVYQRTDARTVLFKDEGEPFSYRVPGVANEFWPEADRPPGGENYGWGATLPLYIIRNIIGFREMENLSETAFLLAPAIPNILAKNGQKYTITNLHYRETTLKVTYRLKDSDRIEITLEYSTDQPKVVTISDGRDTLFYQRERKKSGTLSFDGVNGSIYVVKFN